MFLFDKSRHIFTIEFSCTNLSFYQLMTNTSYIVQFNIMVANVTLR